ncbi:MAG: ribonuclease III [Bacteroidetes bacterium]|nr:MAG: ribonuclease III [Bacteroidota bacterium]
MKSTLLSKLFPSKHRSKNPKLKGLRTLLGFKPGNKALYEQAFRHNSYVNPGNVQVDGVQSNERLEYLGDAVLDLVVAEMLFMTYPTKGEGFLTETRSKIVSREKLADLAIKMGLDEMIQYGKGLGKNRQVMRSLAGNALEALIGAIYLDKGYNFTKELVIQKILKNYLDMNELVQVEVNFKSRLIEWTQKQKKDVEFVMLEEKLNGRHKTYVMEVRVDGETMGNGEDFSKKKAEQLAARIACERLNVIES